MKELIKQALTEAYELFEKEIPQTKTEIKTVMLNVEPINIVSFMKDNDIPDDAWFSTAEAEGFCNSSDACLCYRIKVPTTDKDKLKFKKEKFTQVAWKFVYDLLKKNNYKRVGYNTGLLDNFRDTTVYDMYIANDFDRLVKYYSLPFILNETNN